MTDATPHSIFAIGDIHGQHDLMRQALARIDAYAGTQVPVVILGDLVDRGPDSKGVIDTLIAGIAEGRDWTVLMGNHDRLFLDFLDTGAVENHLIRSGLDWLNDRLGGRATLASYGVDTDLGGEALHAAARAAVPEAHVEFLRGLKPYHLTGDTLFVHAGIRPNLPLEWQGEDEFLWIRDPFLNHTDPFEWFVVHGHTALEHPRHHGNRVNLDGGAGWGRPIYPALIQGRNVWLLDESGPVHLAPEGDA